MKDIFQKLHTYGGFLFFPLLIIFGISALHINHKFSIFAQHQVWTESHVQISIVNSADNMQLAEVIRDSLGIMGWLPDWRQERNGEIYWFNINHNGAENRIEANLETGVVKINRRATGFGSVLNSLHFFNTDLPGGSLIINSWQYYKNACFFYIILAIISGLYFFLKRQSRLIPPLIFVGSALIITILLIIFIW